MCIRNSAIVMMVVGLCAVGLAGDSGSNVLGTVDMGKSWMMSEAEQTTFISRSLFWDWSHPWLMRTTLPDLTDRAMVYVPHFLAALEAVRAGGVAAKREEEVAYIRTYDSLYQKMPLPDRAVRVEWLTQDRNVAQSRWLMVKGTNALIRGFQWRAGAAVDTLADQQLPSSDSRVQAVFALAGTNSFPAKTDLVAVNAGRSRTLFFISILLDGRESEIAICDPSAWPSGRKEFPADWDHKKVEEDRLQYLTVGKLFDALDLLPGEPLIAPTLQRKMVGTEVGADKAP